MRVLTIIKRITIILATILWVSACKNIDPRPNCDISFQFDRCRCRCYEYDEFKTVDDSKCNKKRLKKGDNEFLFLYNRDKRKFEFKSGNYPLEVCEGISGAYLQDLAREILPKAKYNKNRCDDLED